MDIFLDEQKLEITLENEKTLGDILNGIESECEKLDATIVAIEVDGKKIEPEKIDYISSYEIDKINVLKISTVCKNDIYTSLKQIKECIEEIEGDFSLISANLQTGKDAQVNVTIKKFADIFDGFCKVITFSALFPKDFSNFTIAGSSVSDFLSDFSPILLDFEDALEQKDTVLISDLAEYEILPRLQNIKDFCNENCKNIV